MPQPKQPSRIGPEKDVCPLCGVAYRRLTGHWRASSKCSEPEPPEDVIEILRGVAMVRGGVADSGNKSRHNYFWFVKKNAEDLEPFARVLGSYSNKLVYREVTPGFSDETFRQCQLKTSTSPFFTDRELRPAGYSITPVAAKTLVEMMNPRSYESEDLKYVCRANPGLVDRAVRILSDFGASKEKSGSGNPRLHISSGDALKSFTADEWPVGWWNNRYVR